MMIFTCHFKLMKSVDGLNVVAVHE